MATLLGSTDAAVREAIEESRRLLEQMGAGLWLARLDAADGRSAETTRGRDLATTRRDAADTAVAGAET